MSQELKTFKCLVWADDPAVWIFPPNKRRKGKSPESQYLDLEVGAVRYIEEQDGGPCFFRVVKLGRRRKDGMRMVTIAWRGDGQPRPQTRIVTRLTD